MKQIYNDMVDPNVYGALYKNYFSGPYSNVTFKLFGSFQK